MQSSAPLKKCRYVVGIDVGRNTGIAVYDRKKKKIIKLMLLDFWATIDLLNDFLNTMITQGEDFLFPFEIDEIGESDFEVIIEDPQLNAPLFFHKVMSTRIALSKAQDVGRNKEQAFLMIEYLKRKKIKHRISRPTTAKWNAEQMALITKWPGSSNEHTRDAAKLCFCA